MVRSALRTKSLSPALTVCPSRTNTLVMIPVCVGTIRINPVDGSKTPWLWALLVVLNRMKNARIAIAIPAKKQDKTVWLSGRTRRMVPYWRCARCSTASLRNNRLMTGVSGVWEAVGRSCCKMVSPVVTGAPPLAALYLNAKHHAQRSLGQSCRCA